MDKDNSAARTGDRRRSKRRFVCALLLLGMAGAPAVDANDMHLLINGKAIHFDERPGTHYNESNWGAGFQYDLAAPDDAWVPFITASGFVDSNRNPSYYAGGGLLRRYHFRSGATPWHADVGGVAFVMQRKGFKDGDPFLGVLPAFSVGTDSVAVNVSFVPRVDPKAVPLLFLQLKINLDVFLK